MPTLAGITGASLQPGVDIVETLRQGAVSGEQLRQITQRKGMDRVLSGGALTGGTTGGAATSGAAGPTVAGTPMETFAKTGQVDTSKGATSPMSALQPKVAQLRQFGIQGNKMADILQAQINAGEEKQYQAAQREIQSVATAARTLREMKPMDREFAIAQMRRNSGGNPNMLEWLAGLEKMTPQQQEIALKINEERSVSALEDRKQDRDDRLAKVEEDKIKARADENATARRNAEIAQQKADATTGRLELDVKKYAELPATEQRALADEAAKPVIKNAVESTVSGMQMMSILDRTEDHLLKLQALKENPSNTGLRQELVNSAAFIDEELSDQLSVLFGANKNIDFVQLNQLQAKLLQKNIKGQPAPFSDRNQAALAESLPNIYGSTIEAGLREVRLSKDIMREDLAYFNDIQREAIKKDGGSIAVMQLAIRRGDLMESIQLGREAIARGDETVESAKAILKATGYTEEEISGARL